MNTQEEKILNDITGDMVKFSGSEHSHRENLKGMIYIAEKIVEKCGTSDYLFALLATKFYEHIGINHHPIVQEILDTKAIGCEIISDDGAFCMYYVLGVFYWRNNDVYAMETLIRDKHYFDMFSREYMLYFDALGRYLLQIGSYDSSYLLGKYMVETLSKKEILAEACRTLESGLVQSFSPTAQKVTVLSSVISMLYTANQQGLKIKSHKSSESKNIDFATITYDNLSKIIAKPFDLNILDKEMIVVAKMYADQAVLYNQDYSKYYFLKAKIIFESRIAQNQKININVKNDCLDLINQAIKVENSTKKSSQIRIAEYKTYIQRVKSYTEDIIQSTDFDNYSRQKVEICRAKDILPHEQRPSVTTDLSSDGYVFISYSSKNFKQVYCDLIEMKKRNICFWYDAETIPGEKWDAVVGDAIKNASCVICFISDEYFSSEAVIKELKMMQTYNKKVISIDLSRKYSCKNILCDIIKNNDKTTVAKVFTSEYIQTVVDIFNTDIDLIERDKDPLAVTHIDRLYSCLKSRFEQVFENIIVDAKSVMNNKYFDDIKKPNEDYFLFDERNKIFAVADGITTNKNNYKKGAEKSIATEMAIIFCEGIVDYSKKNLSKCNNVADVKSMLISAFRHVTILIKKRNECKDYVIVNSELPGCVGVVGIIYKDNFIYISFGDCMNILVRNQSRIILNPKQTTYAFEKAKVENDRQLLSEKYVNKSDNEYGYCVMNGDKNAHKLLNIASIKLEKDDTIYMISDGLSDYIESSRNLLTHEYSIDQIIQYSTEEEKNRGINIHDDKTIIMIKYIA